MDVTAAHLNRASLARQLLLERQAMPVVDGIRHLVGLQAQEPASPYVALWNRLAGFDPADLDAAFASHAVVKASLVRLTLHAVAVEDHAVLHAAMLPSLRASRLADKRYTSSGLTVDDADAALPELLEYLAEPRTKAEIEALFHDRHGADGSQWLWWALRTFAPLVHAPGVAPWSFDSRKTYRAAPPPSAPAPPHDVALQHLVWRYLVAFGPATIADVGQFTMLQRAKIRAAVEALGERLITHAGPDGTVLYDVPDAPLPEPDVPVPPRLLGMWDNLLLAYLDRSRVIPERHRAHVIRRNGDVLPSVLVDGRVAGVWRPVVDGIEVTAFDPLTDDAWDGLAAEASRLHAFLVDRDPNTYGRYARWWGRLPDGQTRVLPAP